MKIELKAVKVHNDMSQETTCFSAQIYIDGKKAGEAHNEGHGGPTDVYIADPGLLRRAEAFCKALPAIPSKYFPDGLQMNLELYIDELVSRAEEEKELKRWCRTSTIFRLKNTKKGEWMQIHARFTPAMKASLQKEHGDQLVEIANERFA